MSTHIDKIFYINLDYRKDRRTEIEEELTQFHLLDTAERFTAIHTPSQGILGCTMSHLSVLKLAKERNYKNVLILEDDFQFTVLKEEFENMLQQFFETITEYNVCMISYNLIQHENTEHDFLLKVKEAQTASGYIVHHSFYDSLINLYDEAIPKLEETKQHWIYANDQIWKRLQPNSNWYCFTKKCGKQRDGFSDNSGQYENYDC